MATSSASLEQIYNRLSSVTPYHPLSADTFSDWSMEAGDIIRVTRDGKNYDSPVHSSSMNWKGQSQISVSSNGNEKRENIAKQTIRKYNKGSSGYRNSGKNFQFEANMKHLLYEVDDENGAFSRLEVNLDGLTHEVMDEDGRVSLLSNTVDGLYHEVSEPGGSVSILQNTVNGLSHEVYDPDGNVSILLNTAQGLSHEVYDPDGAFSLLENTVNGLYHEVNDSDGKVSILMNTADGLYHEVYDQGGLKTQVSTQAGTFNVLVSGSGANAKIKPAAIQAAIDTATGQSKILLSADNVVVDGTLVTSKITADYLSAKIATIPVLSVQSMSASGSVSAGTLNGDTIRFRHSAGAGYTYTDLKTAFVSSITLSHSGNTYTLKSYDANANETVIGSFSRATSLSGSWSGGTLTVSASPQGNDWKTAIKSLAAGDITWNGNIASFDIKAYNNGAETAVNTGRSMSLDATARYNAGWDACYNTLDATGTTSSGTLSYGGSASVVVKLKNSSGTMVDRVLRTYRAPTDANIASGKIKHGVTIFGTTGTYGIIANPSLVKAGRNDGEALKTLDGDQYIRAYCVNPDGQGQYDDTVYYVSPDITQVTISSPQGTAIRDGYTNNQYGYAILNSVSDANQRKAGIGVQFNLQDKNFNTIATLTSYLEWAPTNLYKKGYQDGLNTGIGYEAYQGFGFITSNITSPDATISRNGFSLTANKGFRVTTVGRTYYFKFSD